MPPPAFPIALSERIFKGKSFFPSKFLLFRWKYYIRWYPVTVRHHLKCLWFLPIGGEWPIRQISRVQNSTENFFRVKDKHSSSPCPYISVLELSHFLSFYPIKRAEMTLKAKRVLEELQFIVTSLVFHLSTYCIANGRK